MLKSLCITNRSMLLCGTIKARERLRWTCLRVYVFSEWPRLKSDESKRETKLLFEWGWQRTLLDRLSSEVFIVLHSFRLPVKRTVTISTTTRGHLTGKHKHKVYWAFAQTTDDVFLVKIVCMTEVLLTSKAVPSDVLLNRYSAGRNMVTSVN